MMKQHLTSKTNYWRRMYSGLLKTKLAIASIWTMPLEWKLLYSLLIVMTLRLTVIAISVIKQH